MERTGIQQAVDAAGGQRLLAEKLKSTVEGYDSPSQQAISLWVKRGFVPNSRVAEVSRLTGVPAASLMDPALREVL